MIHGNKIEARSNIHDSSDLLAQRDRLSAMISSSALLSLGMIEQEKGAGRLIRRISAFNMRPFPYEKRHAMTVPYAISRKWIRIGPSIRAFAPLDLENRE
jgi:hypothetical protein